MTILHIGQLGISIWPHTAPSARERRVEMIARESSRRGHKVTILGTVPYVATRLGHTFGITLISRPSLNPQQPGGWLYVFTSFWTLWRQQPHVVHLHGWRAGALAWLAALLSPESVVVWSIDTVSPRKSFWQRLVAKQAHAVCDHLTVPSRTIQYFLYHFYRVRSRYIPDGYLPATLSPLPLKRFGVRAEQYYVLLGSSAAALQRVVKLYGKMKSRKKLVVAQSTDTSLVRHLRRESRTLVTEHLTGRRLDALLRGTAGVIVADATVAPETLLTAMAYGRMVIAPHDPLYQETLGVTGKYYRMNRLQELSELWQASAKKNSPRHALGRLARARAIHHFTWERVTSEYLTTYVGQHQTVTVDSVVVPAPQTQLSVANK